MKPFSISISTINSKEVAIFSNANGDVVPLSRCKVSKRLAKIKKLFKANLCSSEHFYFSYMSMDQTEQLKQLLK